VSCAKPDGCNGGYVYQAFDYLSKTGACLEVDDPFISWDNDLAPYNTMCERVRPDIESYKLYEGEPAIFSALHRSPGIPVVSAGNLVWQFYSGGVVTHCPPDATDVDHSGVVVGYDAMSIKLRHSWGPNWGENDHIRLARGLHLLMARLLSQQVLTLMPIYQSEEI
jgi:Papain family cysteine protease